MSDNDIQAVGRVYLYKYPLNTPVLTLTGQDSFEQFGYDIDMSIQLKEKKQVLAVSSYTKGK